MARNPLTPSRSGGLDPFLSLHRDVNRMFDELYRGGARPGGGGSEVGQMLEADLNVSETDGAYRVTAEIPGVRPEDIDIRLDDDILTIQGEKRFEREEGGDKEDFHLVERSYGTFRRSIRLPRSVDADKVHATCENGVLHVTLPKSPEEQRSRRVEVKAGPDGGAPAKSAGKEHGKEHGGQKR